jgi:DNA mismatch endonuclease, patch repair protein
MVDASRSRTMRAVRSTGNASTELRMVCILREQGLSGWRRHLPLPGRPDFAWPKQKVALFVDGCFWHACPRCNRPLPVTNAMYWKAKVARNVARDRRVTSELRSRGWTVLRVWEHALARPAALTARLRRALAQ